MERTRDLFDLRRMPEKIRLKREARGAERDNQKKLSEEFDHCLNRAFDHLDTLIPPERRTSKRPRIRFTGTLSVGESHKRIGFYLPGSRFINAAASEDMATTIPHESFHFWQYRDGLFYRTNKFHYDIKQLENTAVLNIIRGSIIESGAYLFQASFNTDGTKEQVISDLMSSLPSSLISIAYSYIRADRIQALAKLGLESAGGFDFDHISIAKANMGRVIATLTLAASDYDIRKTIDTLSSNTGQVFDTIKNMDGQKASGLLDALYEMNLRSLRSGVAQLTGIINALNNYNSEVIWFPRRLE